MRCGFAFQFTVKSGLSSGRATTFWWEPCHPFGNPVSLGVQECRVLVYIPGGCLSGSAASTLSVPPQRTTSFGNSRGRRLPCKHRWEMWM